MKSFIKYYKPHWKLLVLDIFSALIVSSIDLIYPMFTRDIINNILPNEQFDIAYKIGLILLILFIIKMVFEYIIGYYGHVLGTRMEYDMRKDIFSHIQKLSFRFYDNTKTGHLMSRIVNDLQDITEIAHHGPEDLFISIIKIAGSFTLLMYINVKLALIVFIIVPIMFLFMVVYNKKLKVVFSRYRESVADINAKAEDSISGIRVVKSFTNESVEIDKFNVGNENYKNIRSKTVKHIGIFDAGVHFFSNISIVITLVFGVYFYSKGLVNIGDIVAFIIYISLFTEPIRTLARFIEQYQQGMAGFRRFQEIMNIDPDIEDRIDSIELNKIKGNVIYNNVNFSYNTKENVLNNINLNINQNETVAIVGPSGAGKTSLCNLIPRFYEITEGTIKIDGIDIRDIKLKSLRQNIGIVQQDVFLFSGTIKDNIIYGKIDATNEEILLAAKYANAHEFIMNLPEGYDTNIGERGTKLSGGQKQRISIARMFLKNPPILILDEATSSLDNASEAIIQESIEKLSEGRTTLIIAHRLATIRNAKRIVVLSEKGIEEEGTHEELLLRKGCYFDLYHTSFDSLIK